MEGCGRAQDMGGPSTPLTETVETKRRPRAQSRMWPTRSNQRASFLPETRGAPPQALNPLLSLPLRCPPAMQTRRHQQGHKQHQQTTSKGEAAQINPRTPFYLLYWLDSDVWQRLSPPFPS